MAFPLEMSPPATSPLIPFFLPPWDPSVSTEKSKAGKVISLFDFTDCLPLYLYTTRDPLHPSYRFSKVLSSIGLGEREDIHKSQYKIQPFDPWRLLPEVKPPPPPVPYACADRWPASFYLYLFSTCSITIMMWFYSLHLKSKGLSWNAWSFITRKLLLPYASWTNIKTLLLLLPHCKWRDKAGSSWFAFLWSLLL
jgi:hypothetical protein